MDRRVELNQKLVDLIASFGVWFWDPFSFETGDVDQSIIDTAEERVYFQPPSGYQIKYPCLVYEREGAAQLTADDAPYFFQTRYSLTFITRNPDSQYLIKKVKESFPYCKYDRSFTNDNLYHEVFTLYY